MDYNVNLQLENKSEAYALNQVGRQANATVWQKSGDTVILASVVYDETEFGSDEFLPLTVQYVEKTYAAGKFPGGFFKRETKPSDFETLTSRIVDRALRPLFPKGFAHPIQISIIVFSVDAESDLQVLALNAASAALYLSDIAINTSVTGVRVGKVEGEVIFNPTMSQLLNSTLDVFLAGSKDDMLMIEMRTQGSEIMEVLDSNVPMVDPMIDPAFMGSNITKHSENAMPEDELITVLEQTQAILKVSNELYEKEFTPFCKEVATLELLTSTINDDILAYITANHLEEVDSAINQMAKSERSSALRAIRKEIVSKNEAFEESDVKKTLEKVKRERVRSQIINDRVRADGRGLTEVRPITIETNVLPSAHASCLFTRGQTQALVILTLGGSKDAQMYETLASKQTQNETFMVHYNFPGFSVGEPSPMSAPRRRELGHGNLAKRALESSLDNPSHTMRLVSEILESNGSSSMATVCGGYMALRAGDIDMSATIAGVAMGLVVEDDKYAILTDIMGLEDHDGDMDFKVTGSKDGITALQMDIKLGGVSLKILKEAFYQAREGRSQIIDIMDEAEAKIELNEGALPSGDLFTINPERIAEVIGQAGKTIREIIEKFEVGIDIDKKLGHVKLSGKSKVNVQGARAHIESIVSKEPAKKIEYNVGDVVDGIVKRIVDFGAFVELPGGVDGLLHISKVSDQRVNKVSDVLSEGQSLRVEIIEFKGNKISLDRAK